MILKDIDFTNFFIRTEEIFKSYFSEEQVIELMDYVGVLSDANFRCYRANMIIIANRKEECDHELVSDLEWVARNVGEYRVASKANINRFIHNIRTLKEISTTESWITDDIVYSIGEMMDRLSIETIKREDFLKNNRPKHMADASQDLSNRVEKYLIAKLKEIDKKGFYECIHEQRTYDLEGILEDLVI